MKILVVGDGASELHEIAVSKAFESLGHEVVLFAWHTYFRYAGKVSGFFSKLQNKFMFGPLFSRMNDALVAHATIFKPDLIFVYRGTHIHSKTLARLSKELPTAVLIGYNNDDPYAKGHPFWLWRHFISGLSKCDMVLAYRHHNVQDFKNGGARRVELLRSWFLPDTHKPSCPQKFSYDVVFVGHYEADSRIDYLSELVKSGVSLKIFGPEWERAPKLPWLEAMQPIKPMRGKDYVRVLSEAKIALCFLSKLNRDTYTRRSFEIPAIGTLMLSEYTDDLASLFEGGVEADYFRSPQELVMKAKYYLANLDCRDAVAAAGRARACRDGHDIVSRMSRVLNWYDEIEQSKNGRNEQDNCG